MTTALTIVGTKVEIDLGELYPELVRLANREDRSVEGQLKHMLRKVFADLTPVPQPKVTERACDLYSDYYAPITTTYFRKM